MAYFDKYGVEFSDDRKTLVCCPDDFTGYTIPNGVTRIGKHAFSNCTDYLKGIDIPNSVSSIEEGAFSNCAERMKLTEFFVAADNPNYCSIDGVLFNKDKTTLVAYPAGRQGAYTIPNSVINIGEKAFYGCMGLTSIEIPNSVTSIGNNAFSCCDCLTSIIIPDSVTSIGDFAFSDCGLTAVTIPNSVTSIGEKAFHDFMLPCRLLTINVAADNPSYCSIDGVLFNKVKTTLIEYPAGRQGAYTIPNSVIIIGERAFEDSGLTSIIIPNSVTSIGNSAFAGCRGLTSVTIPDNVTSIGDYAFLSCRALTSITIPNGIANIGEGVLCDCTGLKDPIYHNNALIYVPRNQAGVYSVISGTVKISGSAFTYCSALTGIEIPSSVTSIGDGAFDGCSGLKEIFVPFGQEERFCKMDGLKGFAVIIRETSEKQKAIIHQREEQEQRRMQEQQMQEMLQDSILFFDTETTGVPRNYRAHVTDSDNWPRLVQLAWIMTDKNGNVLKKKSVIIKPDGFSIPTDASAVHGITTERAQQEGKPLQEVLEEFTTDLSLAELVVGHNIDFDQHIVGAELYRLDMDYDALMDKPCICTMKSSTDFCAIPSANSYFSGYKWPSLQELYHKLFNKDFDDAHDALADITATKDCFFELKKAGIIK